MIKIAPSILSADFSRLGDEVEQVRAAGADYLHFDVMDGTFVPNISIGVPVLKSLRGATDMFIDAHLMVDRPIRYVRQFCEAGADLVNVHVEADSAENTLEAIRMIRACGKKVGVTIKPATPARSVIELLPLVDLVLAMTVEPGFGGQSFMYDQLEKISELRAVIDRLRLDCELEVDGGISVQTAAAAARAGATVLVAGSSIFGRKDRRAAVAELRDVCER